MAGLFGFFNFNKEGKGINPEDLGKGPISTFLGIIGRKFWKLVTINIMYIVFNLPALIISFFMSAYFIQALFPKFIELFHLAALAEISALAEDAINLQYLEIVLVLFLFAALLCGLAAIVAGPTHAGIVYVIRNYAREEHAFLWSDFKDNARSNFKQAFISGLLSLLITIIFIVNTYFYRQTDLISNELTRSAIIAFISVLYLLWLIMQMYLYPMMVTFDLNLKQMYKNCFYFAIMKLPLNVLILFLSAVIMFFLPFIFFIFFPGPGIIFSIVWYILFAFAFNLLLTTFYAYRGINKFMMGKIEQEKE